VEERQAKKLLAEHDEQERKYYARMDGFARHDKREAQKIVPDVDDRKWPNPMMEEVWECSGEPTRVGSKASGYFIVGYMNKQVPSGIFGLGTRWVPDRDAPTYSPCCNGELSLPGTKWKETHTYKGYRSIADPQRVQWAKEKTVKREVDALAFKLTREREAQRHQMILEDRKREIEARGMDHVYVIANPNVPGIVKIGFTTRTPEERLAELSTGTVPGSYVAYSVAVRDGLALEQRVHDALKSKRMTRAREFFVVSIEEAKEAIKHQM